MSKKSYATTRRSPCPLACSLDLFGDKWTLLVVRDMASGKSTFREFTNSPEKIATNILTDRLKRLMDHGLVEKIVAAVPRNRPEYRLTTKGRSLMPVLRAMADWALTHIEATEARIELVEGEES